MPAESEASPRGWGKTEESTQRIEESSNLFSPSLKKKKSPPTWRRIKEGFLEEVAQRGLPGGGFFKWALNRGVEVGKTEKEAGV